MKKNPIIKITSDKKELKNNINCSGVKVKIKLKIITTTLIN